MLRKQISQYLIERIQDAGVECTFGIPGDFVLPLYAVQQKCHLRTVVMTHEPAIGFAADAYGRLKGLGVALVTYGAGGLNMVNPTALAYAEESPLLVVSGGPETKHRSGRAWLHHCVKTFETQSNVYAEVTAANAIVSDTATARQDIDNVFETVLSNSRPGYLELPRDMLNVEISAEETTATSRALLENDAWSKNTRKLIDLICQHLRSARQAVIMSGVQISRFGLLVPVTEISEALNIPVVTSILGKSSFPESHPNFVGTYFGKFGEDAVREFVESCDCVIAMGAVLNEMESGGFSAKFPTDNFILINNEEITIGKEKHVYNAGDGPIPLQFKNFVQQLASGIISSAKTGQIKKLKVPVISLVNAESSIGKDNLSVAHIIASVNNIVDENTAIVCDVGDCLYAGTSIKSDCFIAPGFYSSMGFGVPASIGVQLADKSKRPIVLVGDGGFQMTGTEISTAVKEGLSPIIIIFNNASYAMLKFIDIDKERDYYKLPSWDYVGFARALGAEGHQAQTCLQFDLGLQKALKSRNPVIIDAVLAPDDISPTLQRLTALVQKNMRSASVL